MRFELKLRAGLVFCVLVATGSRSEPVGNKVVGFREESQGPPAVLSLKLIAAAESGSQLSKQLMS